MHVVNMNLIELMLIPTISYVTIYTEAMRHIANRFLEILYKSLIMIVDYLKHTGVYNVYMFSNSKDFFPT